MEKDDISPEVMDMIIAIGKYLDREEVSRAIDRLLDSMVLYRCAGRDIRVSRLRISQATGDRLFQMGLRPAMTIATGSKAEAMPGEVCGDVDIMGIFQDIQVAPNTTNSKACFVVAESNSLQPAYLRLALPEGATQNGSKYMSSSDFVMNANASILNILNASVDTEGSVPIIIHGPASTCRVFTQFQDNCMQDIVGSLYSPYWPPCSQGFFSRPKPYGWPPASLLKHIQQAGCHVVGASHPSTDRRDLEWRWSFSVAEREIIQNMDSTMAGTLYVLKAIKNHTWREDTSGQPKGICSYYFKVACLWFAELTEHSKDTSIMVCVRNVQVWMIKCYEKRNLPHYFIPEQNLICHLPLETCKVVANTLREISANLWSTVLCSIPMLFGPKTIPYLKDLFGGIKIVSGTPQLTADQFSQLLNCMFVCDKDEAVSLLAEATQVVEPGSDRYVSKELECIGLLPTATLQILDIDILTSPATEVTTLPERVVLPIIDILPSIINPDHVQIHKSALCRCLGDVYHSLCVSYRDNDNHSLFEECYQKAETYYKDGLYLTHIAKWHDTGLSGYAHLAKFYFLNGEWEKVEKVMSLLQPLLEEAEHLHLTLNSYILIDITIKLFALPWTRDNSLWKAISESSTKPPVRISSAVLGWYILGRLALRKDRRELTERAVTCMWLSRESLEDVYLRQIAQVFIDVLSKYLSVYDGLKRAGVDIQTFK